MVGFADNLLSKPKDNSPVLPRLLQILFPPLRIFRNKLY